MLIAYSKIVVPFDDIVRNGCYIVVKIFFRGGDLVVAQLSHKFVRSLPWAMGEAFFNTLYGVSVVIVIGRFIAPVELGVASTAIATVALIEVVSSAGLQEAVVRSRSADTDVTDTAFIMAMTFAVLTVATLATVRGIIPEFDEVEAEGGHRPKELQEHPTIQLSN